MRRVAAAVFGVVVAVWQLPALAGVIDDQTVPAAIENQDVQAPRENQDFQAPRENQDLQAPRENHVPGHLPHSSGTIWHTAALAHSHEPKGLELMALTSSNQWVAGGIGRA